MSVDAYNNFVVVKENLENSLLGADSFYKWLNDTVGLAKEKKCNALLFQLFGTANALVENFCKFDVKVRGWIQPEIGNGYLELHFPLLLDNIPPYSTARIGVLIVLGDADNVWVVKERYGPPLFKFVTGAVECGETPADAAARELNEELGIKMGELKLKAIHQERKARYAVDDYCFVYHCVGENLAPKLQTSEILECKKVSVATSNSDPTLTTYTKTLINLVYRNEQEPVPLIRGKKELIAFKFE